MADNSHTGPSPSLLVAAGVLQRRGNILVARRSAGRHLAGFWEFPGGKLEPGESPQTCLEREFSEEFGVQVKAGRFLLRSIHAQPHQTVELLVYRLRHLRGRFKLLAHDAMAWCPRHQLARLQLAPADIPVAEVLAAGQKTPR